MNNMLPMEAFPNDEAERDELTTRIRQSMADEGITHYTMSLVGDDVQAVIEAVNIGIDVNRS